MSASDAIPEPTAHVAFMALEAWGHTRSLCTLALKLVQTRPLYITFFTSPNIAERVESELSRSFGPEQQALRTLVRVAAMEVGKATPVDPLQFQKFNQSFAETYEKLVNGESITCAYSGKEIKPVVAPDAIIMDFFCVPGLEAVRKFSRKPVKVLAWMSGQAAYILHPYAPVSRGGRGDFRPRIMEEVAKTGRPIEEVSEEIMHEVTGAIVRTPGLPPMYDYEFAPQQRPFKGVGILMMLMHSFIDQCDAIVLSTAEPYEAEAIAEIKAWFAETSREVYTFGPLLPFGQKAIEGEQRQSEKSAEIAKFMQTTLESHGPKSLLYISFGSVFWSVQPEKIWAFLDVVMEKKIPFIMSNASPFGTVPDEVVAKVKAYGHGLLSKWSPQQTILAHPVTGWFVTHGGQNSIVESITLGVPMICWPFSADQPGNAARLSSILDVAYELLEVRTPPHGFKPLYRSGKAPVGTVEAVREEARLVLDKAFGEDGAKKRANIETLRRAVLKTWDADGPARHDLERFIATLPS